MEMTWNMNETRKTLGKYITILEDTHDLTMQHKVKVTRT
jgi:hypothetical protein